MVLQEDLFCLTKTQRATGNSELAYWFTAKISGFGLELRWLPSFPNCSVCYTPLIFMCSFPDEERHGFILYQLKVWSKVTLQLLKSCNSFSFCIPVASKPKILWTTHEDISTLFLKFFEGFKDTTWHFSADIHHIPLHQLIAVESAFEDSLVEKHIQMGWKGQWQAELMVPFTSFAY